MGFYEKCFLSACIVFIFVHAIVYKSIMSDFKAMMLGISDKQIPFASRAFGCLHELFDCFYCLSAWVVLGLYIVSCSIKGHLCENGLWSAALVMVIANFINMAYCLLEKVCELIDTLIEKHME